MAIMIQKPSIEKHAYQRFMRDFKAGKFGTQRVGQAFYDQFKLHKIVDQDSLRGLYEADGEIAKNLINAIFKLH